MSIWLVVLLSVAVVLVCILVLRLHAFLTLLLAGLMVAALAGDEAVQRYTDIQVSKDKMTLSEAQKLQGQSALASAPVRLVTAFGETAGKIGILIALASIIGQCLLESGAAAVIVDRVLRLTGPKRAPEALAASAFVLGIPVFFDTVFYLMVPLARSLRERLGKDYVLFILAILAGGSIAHSLVPPTPGPLMVAEIVGVDVATMMMAGLIIGGCSSVLSLAAARLINRLVDVPLRFTDDEASESTQGPEDPASPSAASETGPSLMNALNPIVIPVILIAIGSVVSYMVDSGSLRTGTVTEIIQLLGDKNIALALGVVFAFSLTKYCPSGKRASLVGRSLASAGNIILITSAGGAFGAMLRQAGIEDAVGSLARGVPGLMILPLAFVVTASIRTLQGSATVAMITAAGVLQGFAQADTLPFHPVYLAMAIGAGSKPVSWMTDSAFWVITRMSGMTEAEGLRVISPMSIAMGFSALAFTMLFAAIYPAI
jgi:GntP family gluconate:H+ symporter